MSMPHLSALLSIVNRSSLRHQLSFALSNVTMKTIEEVRLQRLQMLREEFGTLSALNAKLELNARDSTLSQILNKSQKGPDKKPASMGSAMARKLESVTGKEPGWMDNDPAFDKPATAKLPFADLDAFEGQLITLFRRLSLDQKHDVLVEVNKLADSGGETPSTSNPYPVPYAGPERRVSRAGERAS
jgi:hypothetical protein